MPPPTSDDVKLSILKAIDEAHFRTATLKQVPTPDVFLCHSSKDKDFVGQLASDFSHLGIRSWFDAWEIGVGDSLIDKIGAGINKSKFFCIILTEHSVESKWCKTELREAIYKCTESGNNNILPVKYGPVEIPTFLRDKAYVSMTQSYLNGLLRIAGTIYRLSPQAIYERLRGEEIRSVSDVADFILSETKDRRISFSQSQWDLIASMLREGGVNISDQIDIFDRRSGETWPLA